MTIKEFAYSAQQHFQAKTGEYIKRAHIYELLATSFGYNSFAALSVESVVIQEQQEVKIVSQNNYNLAIRQRCVELGYRPATADAVSSELPAYVAEHQINIVRLSTLVTNLRCELPYLDEYSDWDVEDEAFSPQLLTGLEASASKGNALAHYALALIHTPNDDNHRQVGIDYWYNQEKQGRMLTGVEKEWADQFARKIANEEKYEFHLREAGRLGNEQALFDLADKFDDPSFFEKAKSIADHDPLRVVEIAENLGRIHDAYDWLNIAAEAGDIESMRRLIEEFDQDNLEHCWVWLYLAQLLGTDLTKDDYHAIHENGSRYDDDVGGPIFVDGQEGIKLASLNKDQDSVARQKARVLFEKIQKFNK